MENIKSVWINIFGWAEVIIGALGTAVLIFYIFFFVYCLFYPAQTEIGGAIAFMFIFAFLPSPWVLWAGVGVLKGEPIGVRINCFIVKLISILVGIAFAYHLYLLCCYLGFKEYDNLPMVGEFIGIDIVVFLVLIVPIKIFLNSAQIKGGKA